jgi:hypothetical protein
MFVVKPAATSLFVVIVLGSVLDGHVANAHNRRRPDETIRRRTLRGNDGPSSPPPPAGIVATNALDDVLIETASFWGRNLQGSGSFGKGKGGSGKGGSGGGKVRHRYRHAAQHSQICFASAVNVLLNLQLQKLRHDSFLSHKISIYVRFYPRLSFFLALKIPTLHVFVFS